MATCFVIGAGDFGSGFPELRDGDLVVACDGGLAACRKRGIRVDLVIGDFDSLGYVPDVENCVRLPVEKDVTDMYAGVSEGIRRGFRHFALYGGTGGRFSHTVANVQMMRGLAKQGMTAVLYGVDSRIQVICDGRISFPSGGDYAVSIFAIGGRAEGVTISGMKYEVSDVALEPDFPLGVSNSLVGKEAFAEVKDGCLLIVEEMCVKQD